MADFDVVGRIQELCTARAWTYYRLAKSSGIPYSTLSTMLYKTNIPSVPSLMKICDGLGITLAQFFSISDETAKLTPSQKDCLNLWSALDATSQSLAMPYMQGLSDRKEH
ncbi:MAG: helix-turn-helix transcriptional regulator [Oscillibacter sp.]|nr:helix-turn-helix transcriptional regulator [Oscillibacter sp.]